MLSMRSSHPAAAGLRQFGNCTQYSAVDRQCNPPATQQPVSVAIGPATAYLCLSNTNLALTTYPSYSSCPQPAAALVPPVATDVYTPSVLPSTTLISARQTSQAVYFQQPSQELINPGQASCSNTSAAPGDRAVPAAYKRHRKPNLKVFRDGRVKGETPHGLSRNELLQHAASLLGVAPKHLAKHRPLTSVLESLPNQQLQQRLSALKPLQIPPTHLVATLATQPFIARLTAQSLTAKITELCEVLDATPQQVGYLVYQAPDLLTNQSSYRSVLTALSHVLQISPARTLKLVTSCPQLLYVKHTDFQTTLSELSSILDCTLQEVIRLCIREPATLTLSPAAFSSLVDVLRSRLQLSSADLTALLLFSPELLSYSPGVLQNNIKRLQNLMTRAPAYWVEQYQNICSNPRNLAVAISFDSSRLDRLQFLVSTGRTASITIKKALTMEQEDWLEMYPGYKLWRSKQLR